MEYKGKLYGKVGNEYWPIQDTTEDFERQQWIKVKDRLPTREESKENWKFLVSNNSDKWTDAAYYCEKGTGCLWHNGETCIYPTHWMTLPEPPKE